MVDENVWENEGGAVISNVNDTVYEVIARDDYDHERDIEYFCTCWSDAFGRFLTAMHSFPW